MKPNTSRVHRSCLLPVLAAVLLGGRMAGATARQPGEPPSVAESVDLRPALNDWGLGPRSQGSRGTCSAFVVTEALEYAAAASGGEGRRLSVEFLNWASNEATGRSDDGGFFSDLWSGFEAYGICGESELPYREAFEPGLEPDAGVRESALGLREAGLRLHWIKPWDVTTGLTDDQVSEIKGTLRARWPVCAGLRWPIENEWTGALLNTPGPEGVRDGHSVLLVGYRDDPALAGGGVFIFRNTNTGGRDGEMTYEYAGLYTNDAAWIEGGTPGAPGAGASLSTDLVGAPGTPIVGRNRRVSSNQQPGWHTENLDMTWLQPGQSVEMPVLGGPGVITHMWFTSHAGWAHELNALRLRIFWDGADEPAVEAPLGDFFAVGQGTPAPVESVPVQVSQTGSLSSFWRMPFAESARIVVTNDNPERGAGLYWQVDWTQIDHLPEGTPRFYARYRQEYPAVMGRDYTLAELQGNGLYVGSVLSVTLAQDGWFGEGDDFFTIDGEEVPSLQGTGSEDYFNDAWGFRPRTSRWFGSPRWQGDSAGDSGVCYRWHLGDAVNFRSSLTAAIEHKGNHVDDTGGFFVERPDFLSSVAFWYQLGRPAAWEPMPAWTERRVPWEHHHFVRALTGLRVTGDAKPRIDTSGLFGARPVVLWPNQTPGATLAMPFEVQEEGRYALRITGASGPEYGAFDVAIDGERAATIDFRQSDGGEADLRLGTHTLRAGAHTLGFTSASEGAGAAGPMAVEVLRLLRLPPEAAREVRTHHEAHFVRLGIGRAVYAFRLAYGKLPESLQELVDSGVMAERYLRDENGNPLLSRQVGEFFIVESQHGEAWTHRWQGLDARR